MTDEEKELLKLLKPDKISFICCTLGLLGPPLNLVIDLIDKNSDRFVLEICLSVFTSLFLVYLWRDFKEQNAIYKEVKLSMKQENTIE
jgi:hypothetical protein